MHIETGKRITIEEYNTLPEDQKKAYRQLSKKEMKDIEREEKIARKANNPDLLRMKEKALAKRRAANKRNKQSRKNK